MPTIVDPAVIALVQDWHTKSVALKKAQDAEKAARNAALAAVFGETPKIGTSTVELPGGIKFKGVFRENYKVSDDRDAVIVALDGMAALDDVSAYQARQLIHWKPDLSKTEWDKLDARQRAIIEPVITITPASPSAEVVFPKA